MYVCFNLYCGGFILFCNVCVCVGFVMCDCFGNMAFVFCSVCFNLYCGGFILFCNVCVCVYVGFVMCGCFGNMYTVHRLRFLLT